MQTTRGKPTQEQEHHGNVSRGKQEACRFAEWIGGLLKKTYPINLPQDPAMPILGMYPKDAQSCHKDNWSTMPIAELFIIARTWKQPRWPSNEEWIRKIYTMEYYSAEKKNNDLMKFPGKWMELEKVILNEVTQTQKDKHGMHSPISGY